jgi:hypothetical protein
MLRLASLLLAAVALVACSPDVDPEANPGGDTESDPDLLTLEVDSERMPCVGVGPMECLRVRAPGTKEWHLFYDSIQGFEFEPGFRYVLEVERTRRPNPPADASSFRYRLIEILSREPARP